MTEEAESLKPIETIREEVLGKIGDSFEIFADKRRVLDTQVLATEVYLLGVLDILGGDSEKSELIKDLLNEVHKY